mmetsp:Transcript_9879/g.29614  ORF Transcript_9879/g.29614 Transcript_9879/m.29614 type:complete len:83 (-) Transcript_9879:250-498(-)
MTEKASYDLVQTADRDALIGAAFAFRQIDPCDAGRTGVWTPRFENNSKRCIEDAETRRVFSWWRRRREEHPPPTNEVPPQFW